MGRRRVDLQTAAELLGISSDAVRKRAKRGAMSYETGVDGKLYVWVDVGQTAGGHKTDDNVSRFLEGLEPKDHRDDRIAELQETVRDLRARLDREEEANRENRRLLAAALERIPAIEAPQEPRDAPETAPEPSGSPSPRSDTVGAQDGVQDHSPIGERSPLGERPNEETGRRPWWVRWFGG